MANGASVAIDPAVQQFTSLVDDFIANPAEETLRELERLIREILARLRTLGAASLAALRAALERLMGALMGVAGAGLIAGGVLSFWWLTWVLLSKEVAENLAISRAEQLRTQTREMLERAGFPQGPQQCWDEFEEALRQLLERYFREVQKTGAGAWGLVLDAYSELLKALFDCLRILPPGISEGLENKLFEELLKAMRWGLVVVVGFVPAEADAAEEEEHEPFTPEEREELRELGIRGMPYRDGVGVDEIPDAPPPEKPIDWWDVDILVEMSLIFFDQDDLEARKRTLERWIEEIDGDLAEERKLLQDLDRDDPRADIIRRRQIWLTRLLEKFRRALDNTCRALRLRSRFAPPVIY